MIFTVGHGTQTTEALIALLQEAGVARLVDIRTAPGSRRHPQFGKDALAASLPSHGIEYVWRKDLGGWRRPRPDSPHIALRSPAFRGYADFTDTIEFDQAIRWLIESSRSQQTAIMCAESLWWRCHRRMVADALVVRGCEAVHLMPNGERRSHRLHPAARVIEGTRLRYDVTSQPSLELQEPSANRQQPSARKRSNAAANAESSGAITSPNAPYSAS